MSCTVGTAPRSVADGPATPADAVDWSQARCREGSGDLTELFFSDQIRDIGRAKAICAACPVIAACLDGALARREPWGVWGGQLFSEGRILAQKRGRGRPRKSVAPAIQLSA